MPQFHEYPKRVYRRDPVSGKQIGHTVNTPAEEAAFLALSEEDAAKAAAAPPPPAPVPVVSTTDPAQAADSAADKAEIARLNSLLTAVEGEKQQLRDALEAAKVDFATLTAERDEARAQLAAHLANPPQEPPAGPTPADGEGNKDPELPENWRELHHKTQISLAARFVEGVTTKDDAIATLEAVEKRRRGEAE